MEDSMWFRGARPCFGRAGRPARYAILALAAAMALAMSGCGDDDDEQAADGGAPAATTPAPAGPEPKGEPIKTLTITTLESQAVPTYPNIAESAKAYEKWINAKGGIKGRPLQVTICDDRGDPVQAGSCARDAVREGAVAAVGSFTFFGDATVPVLEKADTAWFGICCPQSASELTSKAVFPFGNTLYGAGGVARAVEDGCKNITAVIVQGAEGVFRPGMEAAAKSYGTKINKFITLPSAASDFSPQVSQATGDGADCVMAIFGEALFQAWMPAWQGSGTDAKMYGPQGNLNEIGVKGFEEAADGSIISGIFPDISTEPWADFRQALEEADGPDLDYNSTGAMGTWAAYSGFAKVVEGMTGEINNKTFMAAAAATTSLDLNGKVPPLDLTDDWSEGLKGFVRVFHCGVAFQKFEGGKVLPETTEFQNASDLVLGQGKLGAPGESAKCTARKGA